MPYAFQYEESCVACGKPTHEKCDGCDKPMCSSCLFETGRILTQPSDPRNEDFTEHPTWNRQEELCLVCYSATKKHPPLVLWQGASIEITLLVFGLELKKGVMVPVGDDVHSWYRPPTAGKMLHIGQAIELDTYQVLQFLEFLKANESLIREQAKATSDILLPHARRMTDAVIRADLGIADEHEEK